jgi:hypothetical protein
LQVLPIGKGRDASEAQESMISHWSNEVRATGNNHNLSSECRKLFVKLGDRKRGGRDSEQDNATKALAAHGAHK